MLQVELRESGSRNKALRRKGLVPMAIIDREHKTQEVQAKAIELQRAMAHTDHHGRLQFTVAGEEGSRTAVVQSIDLDPLAHKLIHVCIKEISEDDSLKVDVPVVAIGQSEDMERGDVVLTPVTDHLKLRGKIADMPERIEVDVSQLHVGQHLNAGDISLPPGVELISSPDATVFSVKVMREPVLEVTPAAEAIAQVQEASTESESD